MAGMSFFRARSPVTPKMTRTHGPATRGIRRSRGSRSGLAATPEMTGISPDGWPSASCSAWLMCPPGGCWSPPGPFPAVWVPSGAVVAESVILRSVCCYQAAQRSGLAHRGHVRLDRAEELVPGGSEFLDALFLEHADHVVVADAQPGQVGEDLPGLLIGAVDRVP